MCFMPTESVLQTKNWSGPAKNRFSVALVGKLSQGGQKKCYKDTLKVLLKDFNISPVMGTDFTGLSVATSEREQMTTEQREYVKLMKAHRDLSLDVKP